MGMIGERVLRIEDPDLVMGRGTFIDNLSIEGAAHVVFVRSSVAHGRIVSIDVRDATTMPGVLGVFTQTDLEADGLGPVPIDMPLLPAAIRRSALADGTVRYVGEPIVAVVAETRPQAVDAVEAVLIEFEPLPVVVDPLDACSNDVLLFPQHGSNVAVEFPAALTVDFSNCEVVVSQRIFNRRLAPSPL